jgi:hypothetical protein
MLNHLMAALVRAVDGKDLSEDDKMYLSKARDLVDTPTPFSIKDTGGHWGSSVIVHVFPVMIRKDAVSFLAQVETFFYTSCGQLEHSEEGPFELLYAGAENARYYLIEVLERNDFDLNDKNLRKRLVEFEDWCRKFELHKENKQ